MKSLALLAPIFLASVSAEAPPPGFELWLRNLLYVAGIAWFVWGIIEKARRKPSIDVEIKDFATKDSVARIELKMPTFATKEDVQAVADHADTQLADAVKHLDHRRSVSIGTLHTELTAAKVEIAKVATEAETHTRQICTLDAKCDRILERLPNPRRA